MKKFIILLAFLLGGCATTGGAISSLQPICDALSAGVGPIEYNSTNPKSLRYAGKNLAPILATKNRVGVKLGCPGY